MLSVMMRVIGVLLAVLVAGGLARADFQFQDWWFDRDQPGQLPSGFAPGSSNVGAGRWEVKADPLSSSPPNVLAHISSDQAGLSPQVLFLEKVEAANLELSVRIKTAQDGEGQGSGVIFRAQDDRNYYVVWLSPRENLVRLDKVVNGQPQTLQEIQVETKAGTWQSLRLSIRGPILEAFLNKRFLSAREEAWEFGRYKKGKLGLWNRGAGVVYFDNIRFTLMDGGTGSVPLGGTETTIIK
jgi:hypothetical protein